jgi:hypothetical protein
MFSNDSPNSRKSTITVPENKVILAGLIEPFFRFTSMINGKAPIISITAKSVRNILR